MQRTATHYNSLQHNATQVLDINRRLRLLVKSTVWLQIELNSVRDEASHVTILSRHLETGETGVVYVYACAYVHVCVSVCVCE